MRPRRRLYLILGRSWCDLPLPLLFFRTALDLDQIPGLRRRLKATMGGNTIRPLAPRYAERSLGIKTIYLGDLKPDESLTVTIKIKGLQVFKWRLWLALQFFKIGARVAPLKVKIEEV